MRSPGIFPDLINNIHGEGIDLLGSSIDSSKFISKHTKVRVKDCIKLQKIILQIYNPHCEISFGHTPRVLKFIIL